MVTIVIVMTMTTTMVAILSIDVTSEVGHLVWRAMHSCARCVCVCVCVALGGSFVVEEVWFMVYGLWFVVYGLWFMICGLWFMVYIAFGLRFAVKG